MEVVHLELPRGLSVTVRPWRGELFEAVRSAGASFRQADLNLPFWRWILDDPAQDRVGRLLDMHHQSAAYNARLLEGCARRAERLAPPGGRMGLQGLALDPDVSSSTEGILAWARREAVQQFWRPWLRFTQRLWQPAGILSLGVGSVEELALAAVLAEHVRRTAPQVHTCLTHHRWENFALAPRVHRLVTDGVLLELFDSVVLREDRAGRALASLCRAIRDGDLAALDSVAVRQDGVPRFAGPAEQLPVPEAVVAGLSEALDGGIADYLSGLEVPPDRILMLEALVRNDCHYGKCTFCVQNVGYPVRQQYKYQVELDRSVGLVRRLARHGVRHFSFIDQAAHPQLLEALCARLSDDAPPIRWCIRMLPETALALAPPLLDRMGALGCSDILLGLESVDPATLAAMGKSHDFRGPEAHQWLDRCARLGIDVTLSAMRAYPTESDAAFERGTAAFLSECRQRHEHVEVILNRFVLFDGSPLAVHPDGQGLLDVQPPSGDLAFALDYTDEYGRKAAVGPDLDPATYLGYSSVGLLHRWRTRRPLRADVTTRARTVRPACLHADRDTLVLGSNGYLGRALAVRLPAERLVLSGRRPASIVPVDAPYVAQDLCSGHARLNMVGPRTVWLCARPVEDDIATQADFLRELQVLLQRWASHGTLRRLVLFSTQLVTDTPANGARASGRTPLAPHAPYELAKAQLELFAGYLARRWLVSVDIVRLGLLYGAPELPGDLDVQLLPFWRRALQTGARWTFQPGDDVFGNSWVHVGDLLGALEHDPGPGLRVRSAKSGDFTYVQLQDAWAEGPPSGETLHLPRTRFLLEDELGLPARALMPAPVAS